MTFDEKLNIYFKDFSLGLGEPPSKHLIHIYADYVELVALFSSDNYVSASDIQDRFKDEGLIRQTEKSKDQAESNDEVENLVDRIFRLIMERSILHGINYPFEIFGNDKIKLKDSSIIIQHNKVYIFLLLSSSLNIFSLFQPELTSEFEVVCTNMLKNYLPQHAIVKSFGKRTEYKGRALEKIKLLAADLGTLTDQENLDEINSKGNQERGLDLIGWVPFGDSVPNFFSILGQCACGKDWPKKLVESRRYEKYLKFEGLNPVHSIFIPYGLVNHSKRVFNQNDEINIPTLVFERRRILMYLKDLSFFNNLESSLLVDRCLIYREDIV